MSKFTWVWKITAVATPGYGDVGDQILVWADDAKKVRFHMRSKSRSVVQKWNKARGSRTGKTISGKLGNGDSYTLKLKAGNPQRIDCDVSPKGKTAVRVTGHNGTWGGDEL